jgi:hypothetical protein
MILHPLQNVEENNSWCGILNVQILDQEIPSSISAVDFNDVK